MIGTVKSKGIRFDRGYFFIESESGRDVFAHFSELSPELEFDATLAERRVEFVECAGDRGPMARSIRPAEYQHQNNKRPRDGR